MHLQVPISKIAEVLKDDIMQKPFLEQFEFNIEMLNYRLDRLSNIKMIDERNYMEYQMIFDSVMCLFRALLLENPKLKKNYTVQNYLRLCHLDNKADALDAYLDQSFEWAEMSIRETLKFITDKFVCHVDEVDVSDIGLVNALISHLANPCSEINMEAIVTNINNIINDAK